MFGFFKKKSQPAPSQVPPPMSRGDFSTIDTRQKAQAAFQRGDLEKLFLVPVEFGGPEDEEDNCVYVPIGVTDIKWGIDNNIIAPLIMAEKVREYKAEVRTFRTSVIPSVIKITASNPGHFSTTIEIWGESGSAGAGG